MPKIPVFNQDFEQADILFTKKPGSIISEAISGALNLLDDSDFDPSHVIIIQDDKWGIEAAENGVKWCRLHPIWHGGYSYKICRLPLTQESEKYWIVRHALKYYGRPYDFTGLLMGFPLQIVTKLSSVLPVLRKIPVPLHLPGSFVCSAFVAQVLKDTGFFDFKLLKEWHPTRVTPAMLLREIPWRYEYEFTFTPPDSGECSGRELKPDASRPDNPYGGS